MFIHTNGALLQNYKKLSDKNCDVKNFRLFYNNQVTNLIWYDGRIMYIHKEYFELKNLLNLNPNNKYRCSLFPIEIKLIEALIKDKIKFLLEDNLVELLRKIKLSGLIFDDDIAIELFADNDYTSIIEPIYLGDGTWLNIN